MTPTLYNAALVCPLRALWGAYGDRAAFPQGPAAILGLAFHAVAEEAVRGAFSGDAHERRASAWRLFDVKAEDALSHAHPLTRWRYPAPRYMPFYALLQAEAAENACLVSESSGTGFPSRRAERKLKSRDGAIEGRIDLVDVVRQEVVDYKSGLGSPAGEGGVKDHEARQLRLYTHLCAENGLEIKRGVIVRRDGSRDELPISATEAAEEARAAQTLLRTLNARIGKSASVDDLAAPAPENCRFCSCRPICEPFWREARPSWMVQVSPCAAGTVERVERRLGYGEALLTITLNVRRGTVASGKQTTGGMPAALAEADGSSPPRRGQTVRIVDAASDPDFSVLRARRSGLTTIWTE